MDLQDLWIIGLMLYWGEGGKTQRIVRFCNSDPDLIKIMMLFFRLVCEVPEEKFKGCLHIHEHLDADAAEKYWSEISSIPTSKFFKTSRKLSKASQGKKDSLPNGTFNIYIFDVELFLKMVGWTRGIALSLLNETTGSFVTDKII